MGTDSEEAPNGAACDKDKAAGSGQEAAEGALLVANQGRAAGWLTQRNVLIVATICMVGFVAYTLIKPHQWIFSVQAQSRIVELITPTNNETKWRLNNAILCVRGNQELPVAKFPPLASGNTACGGKHWSGFHISDPEQTLVLTGIVSAILELRNDSLFLALRTPRSRAVRRTANGGAAKGGDDQAVLSSSATLSFTDGSLDIQLNQDDQLRVNIIFPVDSGNDAGERIFPFIADTTIGRDVNWTGASLLTNGHIDVYTADISPDKRKRVDEAELLLGDQLRLHPMTRDHRTVYPKGFVRLSPRNDALDVIAFGAADHVRIERFGDNGYDLKPGLLLLLLNDQALIFVLSVFAAGVGLLTSIAGVFSKDDS